MRKIAAVALLAFVACTTRQSALKVGSASRPSTTAPSGAHIGDDFCRSGFQQARVVVQPAASGVVPRRSRDGAVAIATSRASIKPWFGVATDAYFASVYQPVAFKPGAPDPTQDRWVVEVTITEENAPDSATTAPTLPPQIIRQAMLVDDNDDFVGVVQC